MKLRKGLKYRCLNCGSLYAHKCECDCGSKQPLKKIKETK